MRILSKAWTLGAAVILVTVSAVRGQEGNRDAQAFLVKDVDRTFNTGAGSAPAGFVEAGGAVFFTTADGGLWRTDGTAAGTTLVKAIGAHDLTNLNGTLFFASGFSPISGKIGDKLWKSDGTPEGTVLVAEDIGPDSVQYKGIRQFTAANDAVFFVRNIDGNFTILKSNGTGYEGVASTFLWNPSNLTAVGGTLFFTRLSPDTGTGAELWKSDASGTRVVKDINPGFGSSSPANLTN